MESISTVMRQKDSRECGLDTQVQIPGERGSDRQAPSRNEHTETGSVLKTVSGQTSNRHIPDTWYPAGQLAERHGRSTEHSCPNLSEAHRSKDNQRVALYQAIHRFEGGQLHDEVQIGKMWRARFGCTKKI